MSIRAGVIVDQSLEMTVTHFFIKMEKNEFEVFHYKIDSSA